MEALFYSVVNRVTLDVTAAPIEQAQQFNLVTLGRIVFNGLTFGSIYALVALGIALIYKTSDVVNFGHGEMAMFATFICFTIFGLMLPPRRQGEQLPDSVNMLIFVVGLIGALVFAALMGLFIQRVLLQPLQKATLLSQIMVTIGLSIFLFGFASLIWKADIKAFPVPEIVAGPGITLGEGTNSINIQRETIMALVIGGVLAAALFFFFKFTLVGTAMRAMAQNPAAAKLMGVNVNRLTAVTWMLAMMMAALAGVLAAPKVFLSPLMMANVVVNGFAAAVLGGITSLPGAIVGGLAIGWIDQFVGLYFPEWRGMASFLIIVLVLTIRPNGLLGKTVRKKV